MTKEENTAAGPGQKDPDTSKESPVKQNSGQDLNEGVPSATELETLQTENAVLQDRYLRLAADFENYRRRMTKEVSERSFRATEEFAVEILDIVDNMERALAIEDTQNIREGLEQIYKLLSNVLNRYEITPLECVNKPFDPETQEAIAYIPSEKDEGTVIDEVVKGYRMKDRVIRCARVAVSQGKPKEE
ncbi:hypothetical protein AZH53_02300 [Methanomicrobiaceae archaeon CYW5]|uniref:nucleotide exchange factor GrpE n=1 Tax=Methanovulcanius yangii TaxID=1789227 RepID=UPI0029C9C104|nr:nucleotide exchange factor GrpE [Methanovulcanius yangii]MBT8507261.1 hypothetical protein [Methanovulcanius yangii]